MEFETFDICIIGAGIAGNYLASTLADSGTSICVIEEHESVGLPLQCAGIVSQKLLDLVDIPSNLILNRVEIAEIVSPLGEKIQIHARDHPVVIDRVKFDQYFAIQAKTQGVSYFMKEKFKNFSRISPTTVQVQTNRRVIHCKILVGADGPHSKVARQLGVSRRVIPAAQVRVLFDQSLDVTSMYFNPKWRELFGYIIPEGNSGICRIGLASRYRTMQNFHTFLSSLNVDKTKVVDRQGGVIPLGIPSIFAFNNVVLLGDSAGFVKATTGGGIIMILGAVKILSAAIRKSLGAKNYSQRFFKRNYQRPFKRSLGIELKIHYLIRIFLLNLRDLDYSTLYAFYRCPTITQLVYQEADMDYPAKIVVKLLFTKEFWHYIMPLTLRYIKYLPFFVRILFS